jgi:hypothetical protein
MKSGYINSELDERSGSGLGFIDPVTATTAISAGAGLVSGIRSLFDNSSRQAKRDNRNSLIDALYNAGVSRTKFTDWHSDHWQAGVPVVELIQQNGQLAVDYLNEKAGATMNPSVSSALVSGFASYKREAEARQAKLMQAQAASQSIAGSPALTYTMIAGGIGLAATTLVLALRSRTS